MPDRSEVDARPQPPGRRAAGGGGALPGLQLTLDRHGAKVDEAPCRGHLQRQGATFVKVPRALFQDVPRLRSNQCPCRTNDLLSKARLR